MTLKQSNCCAYLILPLLFVVFEGHASEFKDNLNNLINVVSQNRIYTHTTLRITSLNNTTRQGVNKVDDWEVEFNLFPVVRESVNFSVSLWHPHERKNHSVSRYDLYTFINVIPIHLEKEMDLFHSEIRQSIDSRRDFVILLSCVKESISTSELDKLAVLKVRNKIVVDAYGSFGLWVEPTVFSGNLVRIPSIEEIERPPPMGRNIRGRTIVAAAPETPPFNFKTRDDKDGNPVVDGTICRILTSAAAKFNFTAEIHYTGLDYGTLHPNGSWSGAYSKVHYPDSGFDVDTIVSNELLWTQTDVAPTATSIEMMFGIAYPIVSKHWYAFLLPFELEVWIWTCLMFVGLGIVQGIVMYIINDYEAKPAVKDSTWFMPFAICMEQGLQDIPKGIRYFSLLLLMGCTVLGTGYKSTLRTHLMFPKPDPVPTTFDELADRTDFKVAVAIYGELERHFWTTSEVRAVKKIRERLTFEHDWELCYRKAFLEQKRACVSWTQGKAIMARRMTLNTTVLPMIYSKDAAIRKFLSLGFQENSMYVDSFYDITGGMASMGIVMKWEEQIFTSFKKEGREHMLTQEGTQVFNRLMELAEPEEDAVPLELESLVVAIAFIPFGGIIGLVAFLIERYKGQPDK